MRELRVIITNYLMIKEERQPSFKAHYQSFGITLRMSSEDVLSRIFEEGKNIYDYLGTVINEVVVDGQFLVFNYRYSRSRVKRIKIQLIREDIDRVGLTNRKMEKIQESFTTQLLQKDIEVKELKQKYQEMAQLLQEIKGEIRAEKAMTKELAETFIATEKLEAVAHSISLVPGKQKNKQMIMQSSQQVRIFQKTDHHPKNAHKEYYTLKNLAATLTRITRIGKHYKWYNFVNKLEILPHQKAKYSLTINKTKNKNIMVGFCTEKGLGNIDNCDHAESAYYWCWGPGSLYQGGSRKQTGVCSVEGEMVECVADLASCKLSWWKEGSRIGECAVPAEMRNKPIFLSLLLCNTGDQVDLCICI